MIDLSHRVDELAIQIERADGLAQAAGLVINHEPLLGSSSSLSFCIDEWPSVWPDGVAAAAVTRAKKHWHNLAPVALVFA